MSQVPRGLTWPWHAAAPAGTWSPPAIGSTAHGSMHCRPEHVGPLVRGKFLLLVLVLLGYLKVFPRQSPPYHRPWADSLNPLTKGRTSHQVKTHNGNTQKQR